MGAVASRACGRSRLRAYVGRPLSPHGAVSKMAHRQEAERLHLCSARSRSGTGIDGDFCQWPMSLAPFNHASFAIPASGHRLGREFLAQAVALWEYGASSRGCGSM